MNEAEKKCIYCDSENELHREHIVPKSLRIRPDCEMCETIPDLIYYQSAYGG